MDTFAARLAIVRVHAGGINMRRAAQRAGIDPESWRRYEQGRRPIDKELVVRQVAAAFGVDRDWLMWGGPLAPSQWVGIRTPVFCRRRRERRRTQRHEISLPKGLPIAA